MPEPIIHLLLVDEDPHAASRITELLKQQEEQPFDVHVAEDLPGAIAALNSQTFDLILVDFSLTGAAGLQGFYYIHAQAKHLPVVLLTERADQELALEAMTKGAQDFILKDRMDHHQLMRALQFAIIRHQRLQEVRGDPGDTTVIEPGTGTDHVQDVATPLGIAHLERVLGEGASSTVYLATLHAAGYPEKLAMKLLRSPSELSTSDWKERFTQECQLAKQIDHPNVVQIYECGMLMRGDRQVPFLLMEYVDGKPLTALEAGGSGLDDVGKAGILLQIAGGLQAIHAAGIRHGDVKPGNLLITPRHVVKITDFGIAGLLAMEHAQHHYLQGSPAYMAPEVLARGSVDGRADIFSFGVMAYEWLLQQRPFRSQIVERLSHQIRFERPTEPRKLRRDLPEALQSILARCLRKAPDERYASCSEMLTDLQAFIDGEVPPHASSAIGFLSWGSKDWD